MTTTPATRPLERTLEVPGATLHHEVRGSGPLLLVVGQPMTAEPFAPLADLLATDRTVVTYDPRGLGRSTVADPDAPVTPEDEADDLAAIIASLGLGPADVVGSSGGAVAALALAARHPEAVRTVIAHEPPVTELVPDAPHVRAVVDAIEETYRSEGAGAAWGAFVSLVVHQGAVGPEGVAPATWPPADAHASEEADGPSGAHPDDAAASAEPPAPSPKQAADDALFFLRMLKPFTRWVPPEGALAGDVPRVVLAVGAASGADVARRSTDALAERLGVRPVRFPGDHGGFMADPVAFADAVRDVLGSVR